MHRSVVEMRRDHCRRRRCVDAGVALAGGQMSPGGQGRAGGRPPTIVQPDEDTPNSSTEKPDVAAKKAYNAAMKSLNKAKEFEAMAAAATECRQAGQAALEKMGDNYNRALDLFTEALSNKGDMIDAWDNVGYVHLRLGAYAEAVDDYNHALARKPDLHGGDRTSRRGLSRARPARGCQDRLHGSVQPCARSGRSADAGDAQVAERPPRPMPAACVPRTSPRSTSGCRSATASPSRSASRAAASARRRRFERLDLQAQLGHRLFELQRHVEPGSPASRRRSARAFRGRPAPTRSRRKTDAHSGIRARRPRAAGGR